MNSRTADRLIDCLGYRNTGGEVAVQSVARLVGDGLDDRLRMILAGSLGIDGRQALSRADAILNLPRRKADTEAVEDGVYNGLVATAKSLGARFDDTLLGVLRLAVLSPDTELDVVSFDMAQRSASLIAYPLYRDAQPIEFRFGTPLDFMMVVTINLRGSLFYELCGYPFSAGVSPALIVPGPVALQ